MSPKKDLLIPFLGGLVFIVVSIAFEYLFSDDPFFLGAILGGIAFAVAWFVASRVMRKRNSDSTSP